MIKEVVVCISAFAPLLLMLFIVNTKMWNKYTKDFNLIQSNIAAFVVSFFIGLILLLSLYPLTL